MMIMMMIVIIITATTTTTHLFRIQKIRKISLSRLKGKIKCHRNLIISMIYIISNKVNQFLIRSDQLFQFSAYRQTDTHAHTYTRWRGNNNVGNICIISSKWSLSTLDELIMYVCSETKQMLTMRTFNMQHMWLCGCCCKVVILIW